TDSSSASDLGGTICAAGCVRGRSKGTAGGCGWNHRSPNATPVKKITLSSKQNKEKKNSSLGEHTARKNASNHFQGNAGWSKGAHTTLLPIASRTPCRQSLLRNCYSPVTPI